jgi:hypothetical protein
VQDGGDRSRNKRQRHGGGGFPAWNPRPNDTSVELIRSYEKATAIIMKNHQHDDDLISQYINNGCAYVEVEIISSIY